MQRLCTKLRSISSHSNRSLSFIGGVAPPHRRLIHHHSPSSQLTLGFATPSKWSFLPASSSSSLVGGRVSPCSAFVPPHYFVQVRNITSKDKMAKWKKKWRPRTPITSKVKKVKIKSYKDRFRPLNDGTIRRWKEGKRHNAHLKSKKSKRRLRQPGLVPPAYAKVMKKLNFCN